MVKMAYLALMMFYVCWRIAVDLLIIYSASYLIDFVVDLNFFARMMIVILEMWNFILMYKILLVEFLLLSVFRIIEIRWLCLLYFKLNDDWVWNNFSFFCIVNIYFSVTFFNLFYTSSCACAPLMSIKLTLLILLFPIAAILCCKVTSWLMSFYLLGVFL